MEKILSAFESSAQTSSRVSENTSGEDEDDEKLPKKVDDLIDMVKGLRREIAEFRADQNSIEVTTKLSFELSLTMTKKISSLSFQATNKNFVAQAEELVKANQADIIAAKIEAKLLGMGKSSDDGSLSQLKTELKELLEKNVGGFSDADKTFLRELSNDTKDAIQDMRLEVLTASDKSESGFQLELRWKSETFFSSLQVLLRLQLALRSLTMSSLKYPRSSVN